MTFEDKFYSSTHPLWNSLSAEEKTEILEHARYLTYTGSRWINLLPVFYFFVGGPLFLVTFVLLPYLYLWESIFVVPIGATVGAYLSYRDPSAHTRQTHAPCGLPPTRGRSRPKPGLTICVTSPDPLRQCLTRRGTWYFYHVNPITLLVGIRVTGRLYG